MVSKIRSLGIRGIGGYEVSVECFPSTGLPAFEKAGYSEQTQVQSDFSIQEYYK